MATSSTLLVEYELNADTTCSGVLFEIPETEVAVGDELEIKIWAHCADALEPYSLYKGTTSMGAGEYDVEDDTEITESVDFAEEDDYQADYPIQEIVSVTATTELFSIDSSGDVVSEAGAGEDITDRFVRKGYSCIKEVDKTDLYGTVSLVYVRAPYSKNWYWTVPSNSEGTFWFFVYKSGVLKNKFSIEVPDLADSEGEYKNILLHVYTYSSEVDIEGAEVYVDGNYIGVTDEDGLIKVDNILTGDHTMKVTKEGYVDSSGDSIYNDEFTVY